MSTPSEIPDPFMPMAPPEQPAPEPAAQSRKGGPQKGSGWSAARRAAQARRHKPAAASAPKQTTTKKSGPPDYRKGIVSLIRMFVGAPLLLLSRRRQSDALALDAAAVILAAPAIADGLHRTALHDERVRQMLAVLFKVGPWAEITEPLMALSVQIGANHRVIPMDAAESLGAMGEEALMKRYEALAATSQAA